jgi:hypothetical protein
VCARNGTKAVQNATKTRKLTHRVYIAVCVTIVSLATKACGKNLLTSTVVLYLYVIEGSGEKLNAIQALCLPCKKCESCLPQESVWLAGGPTQTS